MINRVIDIKVERGDDGLALTLQVPKEMEAFFKDVADGETKTSRRWKANESSAKFYARTSDTNMSERLGRFMRDNSVYNDFGDGLLRNSGGDLINIAPLRAVGVSDGLTLTAERFGNVSNVDFEMYIKRLAAAAKALYEEYISSRSVKGKITIEV